MRAPVGAALRRLSGWRARRRLRAARSGDPGLPLAVDLLAACLAAGAPPQQAVAAVGEALGEGPFAAGLRQAARELRLGGAPPEVWGRLGRSTPGAAGPARRLELADTTGIPAVAALEADAVEHRGRAARAARIRVQRAGVHIAAPLGLCFLPAFVLLGIVPVALGLARTLWPGG